MHFTIIIVRLFVSFLTISYFVFLFANSNLYFLNVIIGMHCSMMRKEISWSLVMLVRFIIGADYCFTIINDFEHFFIAKAIKDIIIIITIIIATRMGLMEISINS
jgi:hypothetical protein